MKLSVTNKRRVEAIPLFKRQAVLESFLGSGSTTRDMEEEIFGYRKRGWLPWSIYQYYGFTGDDQGKYRHREKELQAIIQDVLSLQYLDELHAFKADVSSAAASTLEAEIARLNRVAEKGVSERVAQNVVRIGQDVLREVLLNIYGKCCALCETRVQDQLVVSHIIAWRNSTDLRLRPENCILLCRQHDGLFDRGLIGFGDDMSIIMSPRINWSQNSALNRAVAKVTFRLPTAFPPYKNSLASHRRKHRLTE